MKYIIVDDEPLAHDIIISYAKNIPSMDLVGQAYSAMEAMEILKKQKIDLMFLDIEMPQLKGTDFVKVLQYPPNIIITTAYESYALEGYELNVIDYLLKPFSFERFLKAINKVEHKTEKKEPLIASTKDVIPDDSETIFVKSDGAIHQIKLQELYFLESMGSYVKLYFKDTRIITHQSLQYYIEMLSDKGFVQIHKSYIVALSYIEKIIGNTVIIGTHKLPIGRSYKMGFMKHIK